MAVYTVTLLKKEDVAEGTMAFYFKKPEGFAFTAGQYGNWTLLNPPETDEEGNTRSFSLTCAPYEEDLSIATRMRGSAFKRVLKNLPIGADIKLGAPHGSFTLHKTVTTPAVFLTGGIGITPVRSIVAQATHDKTPQTITLFYANREPQDAAFLNDLHAYATENERFTFVPVMTRAKPGEWKGETGHIEKEMLLKYLSDLSSPIYYISGPADMVAAMREILTSSGINEDNIRTEEFLGY